MAALLSLPQYFISTGSGTIPGSPQHVRVGGGGGSGGEGGVQIGVGPAGSSKPGFTDETGEDSGNYPALNGFWCFLFLFNLTSKETFNGGQVT